mmetsp:Transcript_28501/g.72106  ORF Transcript_28501/g.72106 Transcript_28501/m.72106 type:complete len:268 (+) Transcript_28501:459-1262(+)
MHSWCKSARAVVSPERSFDVTSKSPSEEAFFSLAAAIPSFASCNSLLLYFISSFKDCSSISKAWRSLVSLFRAASNCSSDLSRRSVRVSMMPPLWLSYTAPAGAPTSASSLELCNKAVKRCASAVLSDDASTSTLNACTMLFAPFNCSMDAPPFISRSKIPTARRTTSMVSANSFSSARKASCSLPRISVAALRSASSVDNSPESFSTFVSRDLILAASFEIAACSSATSAFPVFISCPNVLERSSHHSENSSYTFCAPSPSLRILA